jgi:hypothetical protein
MPLAKDAVSFLANDVRSTFFPKRPSALGLAFISLLDDNADEFAGPFSPEVAKKLSDVRLLFGVRLQRLLSTLIRDPRDWDSLEVSYSADDVDEPIPTLFVRVDIRALDEAVNSIVTTPTGFYRLTRTLVNRVNHMPQEFRDNVESEAASDLLRALRRASATLTEQQPKPESDSAN